MKNNLSEKANTQEKNVALEVQRKGEQKKLSE